MATPPVMSAGAAFSTMSLTEDDIPGLPTQDLPDTTGFVVDTGYELDANAYALAIAAKTIRFLTCNIRGKHSDINAAAQLAQERLHTSHVTSHAGFSTAEKEVDR